MKEPACECDPQAVGTGERSLGGGKNSAQPGPQLTYRRAEEKDLLRMQSLDRICFPRGVAFSALEFGRRLRRPGSFAILVEEGEKLAGLVLVTSEGGGFGYIASLDVHPEFRRHGVGRKLLTIAEEEMSREGAEKIFLHVAVDNEAALKLYRSQGYFELSKARSYYGWRKDAFLMGKNLKRDKAS